MRSSLIIALIAASLAACHEDGEDMTPAPDAAAPDAAAPDTIEPAVQPHHVAVARTLRFVRAEDGVSEGFDLDAHVSGRTDPIGCRVADFEAPDGTPGIDNAFSQLLPLIEAGGGQALEGLVQSAVNEGDMLVVFELDGLDDLIDDDRLSLSVFRGTGDPFIGTDDRIEPWQTYDIDMAAPWSHDADARLTGGVIEAGPIDFELPIFVFDFEFMITARDARLRLELGPHGPVRGVLGGAISIQNMLDIVENIDGGQQLPGIIRTLGATYADLDPDEAGNCQSLSVAIAFDLTGAFFFEDTPRPDR
ncbi:MAG: hypothetical protein R3F65_15690 [bacterium]